MNSKGQSLVAFVILLPLLLMALCFIVDMGMVLYEQHRLEEVVYDSMRSSTKIEETIKKNEPTSKITITTIDSTLHVKVEKTLDSIFGKVVGLKSYHLTIQYKLNQGKISKE